MAKPNNRPLAVVTGASSGIGLELARVLGAERNYNLVIAAEDHAGLQIAKTRLEGIGARVLAAVTADLSTTEGVDHLYESASRCGDIDTLCANAGIGVQGEFAAGTSFEQELKLINLNVTGQVYLIKRIAADMVEQGHGNILITSSVAGILPAPYMAVYGASKAFLRNFGEAIRRELHDDGGVVTVLEPGPPTRNSSTARECKTPRLGVVEKTIRRWSPEGRSVRSRKTATRWRLAAGGYSRVWLLLRQVMCAPRCTRTRSNSLTNILTSGAPLATP